MAISPGNMGAAFLSGGQDGGTTITFMVADPSCDDGLPGAASAASSGTGPTLDDPTAASSGGKELIRVEVVAAACVVLERCSRAERSVHLPGRNKPMFGTFVLPGTRLYCKTHGLVLPATRDPFLL